MDEATLAGIEQHIAEWNSTKLVLEDGPALVAEVRRLSAALAEQQRENERLRDSGVISDALGYLWTHAPARRDEIRVEALALGLMVTVDQ